jgi:hypothetical protein
MLWYGMLCENILYVIYAITHIMLSDNLLYDIMILFYIFYFYIFFI